ncbi:MAG: GNAT family N-acetyltransferase [Ruminococcus sp.]|nr:GNAT family N-acetyltransferase [Ruminococcus sp.]
MRTIRLVPATINDLDVILRMQKTAFAGLLAKYQDYHTNPGNETIEDILRRFNMPETTYYFIIAGNSKVGVVRIVDPQDDTVRKRISPIFILPEYRSKGYAQAAIAQAERIHGANGWSLDTILQEKGNCYLYEKLGYRQTGKTEVINDRMTLVFYEKN